MNMELIYILTGFIFGCAFSRIFWRKEIFRGTLFGKAKSEEIPFEAFKRSSPIKGEDA